MKISSILDEAKLDAHVTAGEIKARRHMSEPLTIYNYSARCQFEKIWTHETKTCRGLIVRDDGEIIARPFPKFFNLGEHEVEAPIHEPHSIHEKLDGSLGVAYARPSDGRICIATRGAFHSPQAEHATEWLWKTHPNWRPLPSETWLFEIIFDGSRVVVDYGGRDELVCLAVIDIETGRDIDEDGGHWPGAFATRHDVSWSDMLGAQRTLRGLSAEGFVVRFHNSGLRLKVKTDDYSRLHRLVCSLSARSVWEVLSTGASMDEFLEAVPDEFMEWVKGVADRLNVKYREIEKACGEFVDLITKETSDRKTLALMIQAQPGIDKAVCFKMLGGQRENEKPTNYGQIIWKSIYPAHETFRTINEDVA